MDEAMNKTMSNMGRKATDKGGAGGGDGARPMIVAFLPTCAPPCVASAAAPARLLLRLSAASFSGRRPCLPLGRAVRRE